MADQAHAELTNLIADQLAGHHAPTLERRRLAIAEAGRIFTADHKNAPAASRTASSPSPTTERSPTEPTPTGPRQQCAG